LKDQYYGDKRDYFKYGLVLRLLRELKLGHFSFVVMLTRADDTGHGGSVEYGVVDGAEELHQHLHESIRDEAGVVCGSRRNVRVIAPFLEARGLSCQIHDDLFTHRDRSSYFRSVRAGLTQGTVVLLDPDNGLEVGRLNAENGHRYVLFQ